MQAKTWKELTSVVNTVASSCLSNSEVKKFMSTWNEQKEAVSGVFAKKKKKESGVKRPPTGYFLFCTEKRDDLKAKGTKPTEIMSTLGAMWKALSDSEKKPWLDKASSQKATFDKENGITPKKKSSRPKNAYLFFCEEMRPKMTVEKGEVTKELNRRWKAMSDEEKRPYEKRAEKAKLESSSGSEPEPETKTRSESRERPKKEVVKKEKEKEKASDEGFERYVRDNEDDVTSENPKWSKEKVRKQLRKQWEELSRSEREAYTEDIESELDDE